MSSRPVKTLTLLAFAVLSAFSGSAAVAQAGDDPPARVGRVALAQGRVSIATDLDAELTPAQVNWPVTAGTMVTTAAGGRTELRIGSTSVRLDGDSSLEVLALDDDELRLRLHYGSASVRAANPDLLPGFVLETPQARVRLQQPGRVRVDAERVRDTSFVTVIDGVASVEGGGSQLTLRSGRRAELSDEDVRTLAASRDAFDDWAAQRDRYQEAPTAVRYVGTEMTGYEDLDRYGSWSVDDAYGPLWYPAVASTWVPYRDGSWTWIAPWGWTWVDNAPWGYAPFHYGRWVEVHHRWAWVPGRRHDHPVWAPALVGWVGGGGWSATFNDRQRQAGGHAAPALGWYPLSPWERFVPGYRAPDAHLRSLNNQVNTDRRPRDYRPQGLTVVPQDRFQHQGRVSVPHAPLATVPPLLARNVPASSPPVPESVRAPARPRERAGREWPGRADAGLSGVARPEPARPDQARLDTGRANTGRLDTDRVERDGFVRQRSQPIVAAQAPGLVPPAPPVQPQPVASPAPHLPPQPLPVTSPAPHQVQQGQAATPPQLQSAPQGWSGRERDGRDARDGRDGREGRDQAGEGRRNRQPQQMMPQPAMPQPLAPAAVQPAPQAVQPLAPPPVPQAAAEARMEARSERMPRHGGWERGREAPTQAPQPAGQPAPVPRQAAMPAPPPVPAAVARPPMPAPAPAPATAPAPAQPPAQRPAEDRRNHGEARRDR